MILSRARSTAGAQADKTQRDSKPKVPELEELLQKQDYVGAVTLLEFRRLADKKDSKNSEWLAYSYFHYGLHDKALAIYKELAEQPHADGMYHSYSAACLYHMGRYKKAEEEALKGPKNPLQTRLLFHLAHKSGDEAKLMQFHQQLTDSLEDQLSLASVHYLRSHYQEATDIYKRLLLENRRDFSLSLS